MSLIFSDLFEGTEGDELPTYSASWTRSGAAINGRTVIASGRARHTSGGTASAYYRNDVVAPSADYTVRGKFYFGAGSATSASIGLCARMGTTGSNNFYFARFVGGSTQNITLAKMVANTASTFGTYPYTMVPDTEAVLELKVIGDQVSAYLDGALILGPFTDTAFTAAGAIGIRSINTSTQVSLSEMSAADGVVAGGTNYTIAAAAGVFSLAGAQAGITATRKLAGGNGSFSLTGTAAALRAGRRATGATGVITLSSAAASVTASRKLAAAPGAFALVGSNASLTVARRLAAAAGAFTLAGGAAQLVYSPVAEGATIVTSPGQFVWTGAAVSMRITRRLQAQSGSFALAGAPIGIFVAGGKVDVSTISPARIVVFEGSGSRVTRFDGSGSRVTPFDSSGSRITLFEGSGSKTVRFQ